MRFHHIVVMKMRMRNTIKSYNELATLKTFEERFEYLKLNGIVSEQTFASHRWLNQMLYNSTEWRKLRRYIIVRDNSCDLGIEEYPLYSHIIVHHINPISIEDIENGSKKIFDENNLICVSEDTHNAIHYSCDCDFLNKRKVVERYPNDTSPWRNS